MSGHTPGPWFVRTRKSGDEIVDCFVAAKDVQGFAYDAEILGDDEYREDLTRKLADANLIAAAPDLQAALEGLFSLHEPEGRFQPSHYKPYLKAVREALAKSKGETA